MSYKKMFPMFKNNKKFVYLDNAALTQKPYSVIEAGNEFYTKYSISTRTSDSKLGVYVLNKLNQARENIAKFLDAQPDEFIFTSGTTESLNLIAKMLSKWFDSGEIILTYFNHNSNVLPYIENFNDSKFKFIFAETEEDIINNINVNTRIIALPQLSNNIPKKFNLDLIYKKAKSVNAIVINDAAQAIAHSKVSLSNCDVIAFSANKIFGPMGVGGLVVKQELLTKLHPAKWGGGQVNDVQMCNWNLKPNISRFEPGTPNLPGIFQFNQAIEFIKKIGYKKIVQKEAILSEYLIKRLKEIKDIQIETYPDSNIVLFNIGIYSPQDIASYLGHKNIYVRSGVFCAHNFRMLNKFSKSYVRVSLSFYNSKKDIDKLIEALKQGGDFLDFI
ncbi:Probable cysteine desulfurase [Metamycoplasma cloacale]|uniref:Aminotransferase class V-fold PLP-dependent enzyme n=1 Tax=Metamycoplasma cloacale TaxID=92401 RepID=A0A2Z4LLX1_9BACT|nr:aminotransferase class V-fold PLP-dependent enzyme [Metamycoplasma cloacale]AWX42735.1 aminotransferase class V-fold PLP-dependent enzyme [Metamycoplasma cloacale]VEU79451.1 Probable cysteine desulfurase [Metamycoplasma cloacale]